MCNASKETWPSGKEREKETEPVNRSREGRGVKRGKRIMKRGSV